MCYKGCTNVFKSVLMFFTQNLGLLFNKTLNKIVTNVFKSVAMYISQNLRSLFN